MSYLDRTGSKRSSDSSWTSYNSQTTYEYYKGRQYKESCFWRVILNQRFYYIAGLLFNALLLSFYTVMAFTPHIPCMTATGQNVTKGFEFAFKLGFFATAADFINAAFFEFYIRQRNHMEVVNYGYVTAAQLTMETIYAVMEWVFRGLFLLVSLFQLLIMVSATGKYCIHEVGLLESEGRWLFWLIIVQVCKLVFLSSWHVLLNKKKQSFFSNQFDTSTFYGD